VQVCSIIEISTDSDTAVDIGIREAEHYSCPMVGRFALDISRSNGAIAGYSAKGKTCAEFCITMLWMSEMDLGFYRHTGTKLVQALLVRFEPYADRKTLDHFHIVPGRVLGWQHTGAVTSRSWHVLNVSIEVCVESIHMNPHTLTVVHPLKLGLFEVRCHPEVIRLHDHHELLAGPNTRADLSAALGNDPIHRGDDMRVAKVQTLLIQLGRE
jgi:hypothetical protein